VKTLVLFAIALVAIAAGAVFLLREGMAAGGGYMIVGIGQWSLETSLYLAAIVLLLGFAVFYVAARLLGLVVRLPKILQRRSLEERSRRSQEALIAGLIETAEGNWERAEKQLIRHAADSGAPLINYLTAARAAHSRGARQQSDEYLKLAEESMPEAELAIGLTKAELQLSSQQFEEALQNLTYLNEIAPRHATVMRLLHQAYAKAEDWEGLTRLIPQLHANKVLMEAEIKLLETETYSGWLKRKAETRNADILRDAWKQMPENVRKLPGVQQLYFAAMIDSGAGAEIEPLAREALRRALRKEWSESLAVLYGCIQTPDAKQQLGVLESCLSSRPKDPVLLRVLGKLYLRIGRMDKAKAYLESSLKLEPSVEAYHLMGDLLLKQDDPVNACQYFRNGLMFASNEVVSMIEQNREGETETAVPEAEEAEAA
jgi:HemY protein